MATSSTTRPARGKRARAPDSLEDKENRPKPRAAKRAKQSDIGAHLSSKPANASNKQATKPKASSEKEVPAEKTPKSSKKEADDIKAAQKKYETTIKLVDKTYNSILKQMKPNPKRSGGATSDDFSEAMAELLPRVEGLLARSPKHAFDLLMYLGDHAYGDVEFDFAASGYGDTEKHFHEMDKMLLRVIDRRLEACRGKCNEDGEEATAADADDSSGGELAVFMKQLGGKQRPNKREAKEIDRLRRLDLKNKLEKARLRREKASDWVSNALHDLVKTRDFVEEYGIGEHYFPQSIAKLEELQT